MTGQGDNATVEETIIDYISREVVSNPDLLPIQTSTPLIKSGILDSLSLLKLVLFIEGRFGISVSMEEVVPQNFDTVATICTFVTSKRTC